MIKSKSIRLPLGLLGNCAVTVAGGLEADPKIANGSLEGGGALSMELLELLDPKGSDDAAETAKGSVPPEELNGSEALDANGSVDEFVAPLEAADENPPKGSEEKAGTANGSDVENGSADVEEEAAAAVLVVEDEENEPNTSDGVVVGKTASGAFGIDRWEREDEEVEDGTSDFGLGRRIPILLLPPDESDVSSTRLGSFFFLGTLIFIFSPAFKLRSLIGDDKAAVIPAAAWSSLSHSALCSCKATLKSKASFLSLKARPIYACLPCGFTILMIKYRPESTVLSTLPSVTGEAAKTALFSSIRKIDASRPFATIFNLPVHI